MITFIWKENMTSWTSVQGTTTNFSKWSSWTSTAGFKHDASAHIFWQDKKLSHISVEFRQFSSPDWKVIGLLAGIAFHWGKCFTSSSTYTPPPVSQKEKRHRWPLWRKYSPSNEIQSILIGIGGLKKSTSITMRNMSNQWYVKKCKDM